MKSNMDFTGTIEADAWKQGQIDGSDLKTDTSRVELSTLLAQVDERNCRRNEHLCDSTIPHGDIAV